MKKISGILIVILCFSAIHSPIYANQEERVVSEKRFVEKEDNYQAAYDGWLIKFTEPLPRLYAEDDALQPVTDDVYLAPDFETASAYAAEGLTEYIEPNYIVTLAEPEAAELKSAFSIMEMAGASAVRSQGLMGRGVRIAIIDSGIDPNEESLQNANYVGKWNYFNSNDDVTDITSNRHGTNAAASVCASSSAINCYGLAPEADIVILKCFGARTTPMSYLIQAIRDAVDRYDCDVINMSWGVDTASTTLQQTIEYAANKGAILVAAAGNDGNAVLNYPAAYDGVIGVSAMDTNYELASYSQRNGSVDIAAPGNAILDPIRGTSFASPCVAAAAAVILECEPGAGPERVQQILQNRSLDLGDEGRDDKFGHGMLRLDWCVSHEPVRAGAFYLDGGWIVLGSVTGTEGYSLICAVYDTERRMQEIKLRTLGNGDEHIRWRPGASESEEEMAVAKVFLLNKRLVPMSVNIILSVYETCAVTSEKMKW